MDNKVFALGIGALVIVAGLGLFALSGSKQTTTPTGGAVVVDKLQLFCDAAQYTLDDTQFKIRTEVNGAYCDIHLVPKEADQYAICQEVILRSTITGKTTCLPVRGEYCQLLCDMSK